MNRREFLLRQRSTGLLDDGVIGKIACSFDAHKRNELRPAWPSRWLDFGHATGHFRHEFLFADEWDQKFLFVAAELQTSLRVRFRGGPVQTRTADLYRVKVAL